jgi:uncharacterized protein (DUF433 family)
MAEIAPHISVDPEVRFGKPVITGTRVPAELVVAKVAGGMTPQEVAEAYGLTREDVQAALSYAAHILANERIRFTK